MYKDENVFDQHTGFNPTQARKLLEKQLNPAWIEKRSQGGKSLSYVGGHIIIRLLNVAFNQRWSFEVLDTKILGEPGVKGTIVTVHGRMTVPGLGIREQYGNQAFMGGAMDEHTIKGATTDAMKKCAAMFGVALELSGEAEGLVGADINDIIPVENLDPNDASAGSIAGTPVVEEDVESTPKPTPKPKTKMKDKSAVQETPEPMKQETAPKSMSWDKEDVETLKKNRRNIASLAGAEGDDLENNDYLNPFIQEFFENPDASFKNINPSNVKDVNRFLEMKLEGYQEEQE